MASPDALVTSILKQSVNPSTSNSALHILLNELTDNVNIPYNTHDFIGPVMKLLPCYNIHVKQTAYNLLPKICAAHPEAAILAANTIVKDCKDPNPAVKCLAVNALCCLPQLLEHTSSVLKLTFSDANPRVRHVAVVGCGKIHEKLPNVLKELGFIDRLYECIRDSDPSVVTSSLLTLDMVLASEGGVVVNKKITKYLMERLSEFPGYKLATIIQVLEKYTPETEEELFRELDILDPYLVYKSCAAVVVSCIHFFMKRIETDYSHLMDDVIKRTLPILHEFLQPSATKVSRNLVLDFLMAMIRQKKFQWLKEFCNSPQLFYTYENDDTKILHKKLFILPYVCTEDNSKEVLQILHKKHCTDLNTSLEALTCISSIARKLTVSVGLECFKVFRSLLDSKDKDIYNNVVHALQYMDLHIYSEDIIHDILEVIFNQVDSCNVSTVPIILWLLGNFGELVEDLSPYVLEDIVEKFQTFEDGNTRNLILVTTIKLFLKMPAKCQHVLGEVLEKCCKSDLDDPGASLELQQKALKYYHFLKNDIELTKKIFLGT